MIPRFPVPMDADLYEEVQRLWKLEPKRRYSQSRYDTRVNHGKLMAFVQSPDCVRRELGLAEAKIDLSQFHSPILKYACNKKVADFCLNVLVPIAASGKLVTMEQGQSIQTAMGGLVLFDHCYAALVERELTGRDLLHSLRQVSIATTHICLAHLLYQNHLPSDRAFVRKFFHNYRLDNLLSDG